MIVSGFHIKAKTFNGIPVMIVSGFHIKGKHLTGLLL